MDGVQVVDFEPSEYTKHFNLDDIARYNTKLERLNITDPYNAPGVLFGTNSAAKNLPDLQYPDIYNYLVNFPSSYSGDSLKAYKSLEGYKWAQSKFVANVQLWRLPAKHCSVITGRVSHSQRLNDPQLKPWVVVRNDGVVLGAHCNCTAGLGESCSHVSALLFQVWQHNDGKEEEIAVTSKKCKWATPSEQSLKKVEFQQGKDIIFNNSQQYKKERSTKGQSTILPAIPPLTTSEQAQLYNNLSQSCTQEGQIVKPGILSVVKEYAASYVPKAVMLDLPEPLSNLYDKQARDITLAEVQERAEAVFENITVTKEQSDVVEEETQGQSKSKIWFEQRSGRITASTFRAATKTDITKPSVSLIRKICYPKSQSFTTEATRWGCKHEELARKYYEMQHRLSHSDVLVQTAGFRISPSHPFIGASPDGYVSCSCCGSGVLEIKCPFCAQDLSVSEATNTIANFCFEKDDQGNMSLKRDHAYYYQVQMQLFVTETAYCDFILWTPRQSSSPFVERVERDVNFFEKELDSARVFFKKCILPELIAKYFSAPKPLVSATQNQQQWCYCREPEVGTMLVCVSGFCSVKKFHQTCLHLKRPPKQWICPSCRKIINSRKRNTQ